MFLKDYKYYLIVFLCCLSVPFTLLIYKLAKKKKLLRFSLGLPLKNNKPRNTFCLIHLAIHTMQRHCYNEVSQITQHGLLQAFMCYVNAHTCIVGY